MNVVTLCIVLKVSICDLPASIFRSLKVLFPDIVNAHVDPVAFQKLLYTNPPPENPFAVADDPVNFIFEVPAFSVNPVIVDIFQAVLSPFIVHVPDPIVKVLVFDTFEVKP